MRFCSGLLLYNIKEICSVAFLLDVAISSYPAEFPPKGTMYEWMSYVPWAHVAMFWHLIGVAIILLSVFCVSKIKRIFEWPLLLWLGSISYEIYVIGFLIQNTLFAKVFIYMNSKGDYGKAFIVSGGISIILIIVLAYLLHKIIWMLEKMAKNLKA